MSKAVLHNQKIIDEIDHIRHSYIKSRPKMDLSSFKPTRRGGEEDKFSSKNRTKFIKGGGSPPHMKHPLGYGNINGNTAHPDPLYSGVVYKTFKDDKGGALLSKNMPLAGADSESDTESEDGGNFLSESSEGEFSSDDEGEIGGNKFTDSVKEKYHKAVEKLKPVGKKLYAAIVSPEAKKLGVAGLTILILSAVASQLGPYGVPLAGEAARRMKELVTDVAHKAVNGMLTKSQAQKEIEEIAKKAMYERVPKEFHKKEERKEAMPRHEYVRAPESEEEERISKEMKRKKVPTRRSAPYEYGIASESEGEEAIEKEIKRIRKKIGIVQYQTQNISMNFLEFLKIK
jgi:hypothetical protein